jgi:hypothetical protein
VSCGNDVKARGVLGANRWVPNEKEAESLVNRCHSKNP